MKGIASTVIALFTVCDRSGADLAACRPEAHQPRADHLRALCDGLPRPVLRRVSDMGKNPPQVSEQEYRDLEKLVSQPMENYRVGRNGRARPAPTLTRWHMHMSRYSNPGAGRG